MRRLFRFWVVVEACSERGRIWFEKQKGYVFGFYIAAVCSSSAITQLYSIHCDQKCFHQNYFQLHR